MWKNVIILCSDCLQWRLLTYSNLVFHIILQLVSVPCIFYLTKGKTLYFSCRIHPTILKIKSFQIPGIGFPVGMLGIQKQIHTDIINNLHIGIRLCADLSIHASAETFYFLFRNLLDITYSRTNAVLIKHLQRHNKALPSVMPVILGFKYMLQHFKNLSF